jgi:regulator of sigma E protease
MGIFTALTNLGSFALLFGLLVFFHELGHFLAAKGFRMRVEEFAFGFAWPLLKFRIGETQYTVRALPLGGFVRVAGMEVEDDAESRLTGADTEASSGTLPRDHPDRFNNRPAYQRFIVYLAGPVFSFLFGWLALSLAGTVVGFPEKTTLAVKRVVPGGVAERSGVQVNETIIALNGTPVEEMGKALDTIHESAGTPIAFTLKAPNGSTRELTMTPEAKEVDGKTVGLIGIEPRPVILASKRQGLAESFAGGTKMTLTWFTSITSIFRSFQQIKENVGGPVAIFRETQTASEVGGAYPWLLFGQLSLSLGFFNLIPIPILDGGHMTLILLEVIRGKKLSARQTQGVLLAGLAVILLLFVSVMFKDISGLFKG